MKKNHTLKKILKYIGKYRYFMLLSILLAAITVLFTLYIPIIIGDAIDCILGPNRVDFKTVFSLLARIGILTAITALLQWCMNIINNRITYGVVRDIRTEAFQKLQTLPLKYMDTHPSGETVSRVIADADQFADGLLMGFTQLFTGIVTIAATLGFMLFLNWKIALAVVVLTPLSLFIANFIAKRTYSMFKRQSETRAEQTAYIDEMIEGAKVVKAFSREEQTVKEFYQINEKLAKHSLQATFFSSLTNPSTRFVNSVVYACVGLFGALSAISGGITVGGLSCFLSYANQYTKPFNEISGVVTELQNAFACAARNFELIQEPSEVPEENRNLGIAKGNVEIDNVSFSYVKEKPLIRNFNLTVQPGQRIAIVGPTGCGKTTLINLLMRFYDVNSGSIRVEQEDIRQVTRSSLRKNYGMVLQETWLREATVRENISFGRPDAAEEEIIAAAKAAHAHSFIRRLPQGYDTVLSEDGAGLSQGQKQLLCIARIMLCLPPMLILDEATSSIDTRTEQKIQAAFQQLMQDRTSFIVAHRLSTIQNADIILVMRAGNIIEQGTHSQLLKKGGFYAQLYNSQFEES